MSESVVRDVMTRGVWCVPSTASLCEVAARMRAEAISCLIVCDHRAPLGVISERDLVGELAGVLSGDSGTVRLAKDVMSAPVITITPDTPVLGAMHLMVSRSIRRLVVVNAEGELLGVVTQTDLMREQMLAMESRAENLAARISQRTNDLMEATNRLRDSNRQRGEFLATMSHEIRTPLTGILTTVELMLEGGLSEAQERSYLETIAGSGHSLLAVLNDVLDLSKIDAGELTIDHEPFDLRQVAMDVTRLLQARASQQDNEIHVHVAPDFPATLSGDAVRIRQIIQNFVSNAAKFTHEGRIDVALSAEALAAERFRIGIEVRDTGQGMNTGDVDRIFRPYEQAGDDATVRAQGTGLGLAICRRLIELMGGEIGVRSKRGSGSVFWVELILAGAAPEPTAAHFPPERFDGTTVLLAEDDAVSRRIVSQTLERMGCVVATVHNGMDAVAWMASQRYDLVLMDCEMPLMDGFEATAEVRARENARTGQYIVAMTGHAREEDRRRCLAAGMDDYLTKPVIRADLIKVLRRIQRANIRRGAA